MDALLAVCILLAGPSALFATVPAGFQDAVLVAGLSEPAALAVAPDGRLFIAEKARGRIRIVKNGTLLPTPFLDLPSVVPPGTFLDTYYERGLLGMTFDPDFAHFPFVYVYYTLCKVPHPGGTPGSSNGCDVAKNRVSEFQASGDVVLPNSEQVLLDDIDSDAGNHNAGWLGFGPQDGQLYVAVGDGGADHTKSQSLASLNGKVLRISRDGSVPATNPFVGQRGARGEIWAYGFRNPWRCRFHPDGRLFCADVGEHTWEELNVVTRGANYGWPTTEGPFNATQYPQFTEPIAYYNHNGSDACIIGGDFGSQTNFPGDYRQSYFFADYVNGWIQRALLDASGVQVQSVQPFASGLARRALTDLIAAPGGSLYYTDYPNGTVHQVAAVYGNHSPVAQAAASPAQGLAPLTVQFSSAGTVDPDGDPLTFSWDFGDGSAAVSDPSPTHAYIADGVYTARLTVSDGKPTPGPGVAMVTIAVGRPPVVTISAPSNGATYQAGDTIPLDGSAVDPADGPLPATALHWKIVFHHATHIHPFIDDLLGSPQSFQWATEGEVDPNVAYECILSATNRHGLTGSQSVTVVPQLSHFSLATNPSGLQLTLDGQPVTPPLTVTGVVGFQRALDTPSPQSSGGATVAFWAWSDGGPKAHTIATPAADTTYTATFANPADDCLSPTVIPAQGGSFTGTTSGPSYESGSCGSSGRSPEEVFQWTPAVSGTATIQTCSPTQTTYDTVLYVRQGTCVGGTEVGCNDDTLGCGTTTDVSTPHRGSRLTVSVTAGQPYFIVVDGYNGASGTFLLTVVPAAPATTTTTSSTTSTSASATASSTTTTTSSSTSSSTSTTSSTTPPTGTCGSPQVIPPQGGTVVGTTSGPSAQSGTCAAATGNAPEQVFQWTPTTSGPAAIQTCGAGTSFDTVLYVRSDTCAGGTEIACNDDTSGCGTGDPCTAKNSHHGSLVTPTVTAGQTYFIIVDGYAGSCGGASGAFALTVTPPTTATSTTTSTTSTSTSTSSSSSSSSTSTSTSSSTSSSSSTSTSTSSSTSSSSSTSTSSSSAPNTPPTSTTTTLPSETCDSPIVIPAAGGVFMASTAGASALSASCAAAATGGAPEAVFAWTPDVSGTATIQTCGGGTTFDTVLSVRSETCAGGTEIACNDDTSGCGTGDPCTANNSHHGSLVTPTVTAGETYFIIVDGYAGSCGGASGAFALTVTPPTTATSTTTSTTSSTSSTSTSTSSSSSSSSSTSTSTSSSTSSSSSTSTSSSSPPVSTSSTSSSSTSSSSTTSTTVPAGNCSVPQVIPPNGGTFSGTTTGSSALSGSCSLAAPSPEWVFQWTPNLSGSATIQTCGDGTNFDTVLYMRSESCAAGSEVACNDDACDVSGLPHKGSLITPTVTAGQTYYIVVDGYNGQQGDFTLTVGPP